MPIYCKDSIQGNDTENARLDISARGLYGPLQKTMFDVRIFHPNALTYYSKANWSALNRELGSISWHSVLDCMDPEIS